MIGIFAILGMGLLFGLGALAAFYVSVKRGALEDPEETKYVVFRDEDEDGDGGRV